MSNVIPFAPYDPQLSHLFEEVIRTAPPIDFSRLPELREEMAVANDMDRLLGDLDVEWWDVPIFGYRDGPISVRVIRKRGHHGPGPGIFHTHGGGMVTGNAAVQADLIAKLVVQFSAVAVSVDYRLAPDFPDPYPIEDCYAGLQWMAANASDLGIDLDRIVVLGSSAGGGLAAGTALIARDRQGPALAGQLLMCPMLDDRDQTVSTAQGEGAGGLDRASYLACWGALLGDRRGGENVSHYAAPARVADHAGLPPTFIDCGGSEIFRDESIQYASNIWAAGGDAELHIWAGGYHGFDELVPGALVSRGAQAARTNWLDRIFSR